MELFLSSGEIGEVPTQLCRLGRANDQLTRISTGTWRHLLTRQVRMRRRSLPVGVTTFCEAFTALTDDT
jgi:hypothetical protein